MECIHEISVVFYSRTSDCKMKLEPFACPVCDDGTMVEVELNEEAFNEAKRFPMMVAVKCPKKHDLVAFVNKDRAVSDVEPAVSVKKEEKDALAKSKDYFEQF